VIPKQHNSDKLVIQLLAGGISHERDISLKSARRVADALTEQGATVIIREPDGHLLEYIETDKPDVIWPVLHGATGEDGALRDILALTGVPFIGAGAEAARLAWDKSIAKTLVSRIGIQTPVSVTLPKEAFRELDASEILKIVSNSIALPLVVKPARSGSAQGVTVVRDVNELSKAMIDAYVYCDVVIIERLVEGIELAVSVIDLGAGAIALPAVEIEPVAGNFGFEERYTAGETNYFVPARMTAGLSERVAKVAIDAHELLGLRHMSRIDMIVDESETIWFLEANVQPGLTETSLLPLSVLAAKQTLGETYYSLAVAAHRGRG
jgi:D-alanine-D-alanine ligase